MPLDQETYARVRAILARAQVQGHDPAEALEKENLLLTPTRRRNIEAATVEFVIESLENWRPAELLRRKYRSDAPTTPAQMQTVIIEYLTEVANLFRNNK